LRKTKLKGIEKRSRNEEKSGDGERAKRLRKACEEIEECL
jgi:hypothetical protein